jgi:hypothetical protein
MARLSPGDIAGSNSNDAVSVDSRIVDLYRNISRGVEIMGSDCWRRQSTFEASAEILVRSSENQGSTGIFYYV